MLPLQGQSRSEINGKDGVLRIPQSSNIIGASPSNLLVSYTGHSLREGVLPLCREAVCVFCSSCELGHWTLTGEGLIPLQTYSLYILQPQSTTLARKLCASYSPGWILGCAYTICWYGKIKIPGTIPSVSPSPSSHTSFIIFCDNLQHFFYVFDRFLSTTTLCTPAILLRRINFFFNEVSPYGVVLCCF